METGSTTGQVATRLGDHPWRIRRIVDELQPDLPRVGQYRIVPESLIPKIQARLEECKTKCRQGRAVASAEVT